MNFIEKLLVSIYHPKKNGTVYCDQGEMKVEILHCHSYNKQVDGTVKTITREYYKYLLIVNRPSEGRTVIDHKCQVCQEPLKIRIFSKKATMKIILSSLFLLLFSIASFALIILTALDLQQFGNIVGIALFSFVIIGILGLIFFLPLEYKDKGVDNAIHVKFWEAYIENPKDHLINQSPIIID